MAAGVVLVLLPVPGWSQEPADRHQGEVAGEAASVPEPLPIPELSGPIVLDGVVDEPAWEEIDPLPMTMFSPSFGEPTTERSEVRIAYDDENLYVSARMYDSDPEGIRANTFLRNQYSGDDLFAIVIDSFNDHETALWFSTNPTGARTDRTVQNDAVWAGAPPMNWDWNAHWDVATTVTDEGWFAEMRIPFSTLGFQVQDDEVTMGIIVYRSIARKNERQIFPAISPRWGGLAFAKPSQAHRVVLRDVDAERPLYVTPYALGGVDQRPELLEGSGGADRWTSESDPTTEVGLDLQYSPVSNLTVDLTANTDFAQVEADEEEINLTRFPLFFPEQRQFFQERASTFEFRTGGRSNRLFHSRRIGLVDGEITRIYGGARAVGRVGGLDFGLLSMQAEAGDGRGSENASVLRVRQEVLNPYSSVGGMLTSRLGSGAGDNLAYGVDGLLRPVGDEWVTVRWAQTFDEATEEKSTLDAGLLQARWERIRNEGLSYFGEFIRVGEDYVPGLGFQDRLGVRHVSGRAQYQWFQAPEASRRSTALRTTARDFTRSADGSTQSRVVEPELSVEFKRGIQIDMGTESRFEDVRTPFEVAGAEILAGDYWFHAGEVEFRLPRTERFRGNVLATAGSFYDGTRVGVALEPTWNPSVHLQLEGGYEVNRLDFSDRDLAVTTHLTRLRAVAALDTRFSLSALAQYSSAVDLASVNARFRYHIREGTDLWVVYNEGFHTEREVLDQPRLPTSAGRTLMVKYTHTFAR